jgi:hypothetical protein
LDKKALDRIGDTIVDVAIDVTKSNVIGEIVSSRLGNVGEAEILFLLSSGK